MARKYEVNTSEWPTSYSPFDKLCALTEVVALRTTGYRRWYDGTGLESAPPLAPDGTRRLDVPHPTAHLGGIDGGLAGMDLDREPGAPKGVSKGLPTPTGVIFAIVMDIRGQIMVSTMIARLTNAGRQVKDNGESCIEKQPILMGVQCLGRP